jgi:hypothetical protein
MPRTDATFGYSLLTSSLPHVMAPALVDIPTTEATTTSGKMSLVLTPILPPGIRGPLAATVPPAAGRDPSVGSVLLGSLGEPRPIG